MERSIRDAPIQKWLPTTPSPKNWRLSYHGLNVNVDVQEIRNGGEVAIVAARESQPSQLMLSKTPPEAAVRVLSRQQPEIRAMVTETMTIILPRSSFVYIELIHSRYTKVKKKVRLSEIRAFECLTRPTVTIRELLMIMNIHESAIQDLKITDTERGPESIASSLELEQLGWTIDALNLSGRIRLDVIV